jgi:hypothetical protein
LGPTPARGLWIGAAARRRWLTQFLAQFSPQPFQERSQAFARKSDPEHALDFPAQPLTVARPTLLINLGEAHTHKGADFGRELALAAPAGQRPHQLLGIPALERLAPALHRFAIHPEVSLQRHGLYPGVVEPSQEQLKGWMLPLLRHHLQQLGAIINVQ